MSLDQDGSLLEQYDVTTGIESQLSSLTIQNDASANRSLSRPASSTTAPQMRGFGVSHTQDDQAVSFQFGHDTVVLPKPLPMSQSSAYLTPPRPTTSRMTTFGNSDDSEAARERFTFRSLYNASPHPNTPVKKQYQSNQSAVEAMIGDTDDEPRPYSVRDEQPPEDATFFTPRFQEQLSKGIRVANTLASGFDDFELESGSAMWRLQEDAQALGTFHTVETRTIALLGDSGEGKSSVINSLLHCDGIADTSDAGVACTSVITEFRQRTPRHTAPFTIEVEYLSEANIEETIKELLWSYSQLYLPNIEKEVDGEAYKRCQDQSAVAWSTLQAAFDNREEFREALFRDTSDEGQAKAFNLVHQWTQQLDWPTGGKDGFWTSTMEDVEECREVTSGLMQNRTWPFTKVIRIFLNAQVLKTGIILADLPGLRDTNLAKVRATERYLLQADHIFIVAKISRAISDQSLKSSLYTALAQHIPQEWGESAGQSLNVSVVCTRTDEMNFTSLKKEFYGPGKAISETQLQILDGKISRAKIKGDAKAKKQLKRERDLLFIKARNDFVTDGLKRAYAAKVEHNTLEVFCVSNKDYHKHCRKGRTQLVTASGIPELRKFCHAINAQAQLSESTNFLLAKLPNLIRSASLWSEKTLEEKGHSLEIAETREELLDDIDAAHYRMRERVKRRIDEFKVDIQEQVKDYIEQRNGHWEDAAVLKSHAWNTWHWTQYNSWCLHNGSHYTAKRGHVNWNNEIIWKMRTELAFQWDIVDGEIRDMFFDVRQIVRTELDSVRSSFILHHAATALLDSLPTRFDDFSYKTNSAEREVSRAFNFIRRAASEDNFSSYVSRCMLSAYRSASQEFGTGTKSRQIQKVQGRISDGNLFPNIAMLLSEDLEKFAIQTKKSIMKLVNEALKPVKQDVDMTYAVSSSNENKTDAAAREKDQNLIQLANALQEKVLVLDWELKEIRETLSELV